MKHLSIANETTLGALHEAGFDVRIVPRSRPGALDSAALPEANIEGRPEFSVYYLPKEGTLLIGIKGVPGTARQIPLPAGLVAAEPEPEAADTTAAELKAAVRRLGRDPNDPDPNAKDKSLSRRPSTPRHVATGLVSHLRPG